MMKFLPVSSQSFNGGMIRQDASPLKMRHARGTEQVFSESTRTAGPEGPRV